MTNPNMHLNLSPSECHLSLLKRNKPTMRFKGGDFGAWRSGLRRKLRQLVGPVPKTRCTLNVRSLWKRDHPLGTIEKIVYTSEAAADVPGYVCLPANAKPPYTFVVCLQGHSSGMHNSIAVDREKEKYPIDVPGDRDFALGAMQRGFAALCIEQRAFGLRRELIQERFSKKGCTGPALQALLLGRTLTGERVYDVDRGIDYLASRGDVDMKHLGVMGNSTGGMTSLYAAALLPRIKLAMPSCCFAPFEDSLMAVPHCICVYVPGLLEYAEMQDIAGLIAPKPVVMVAGQGDALKPEKAIRRGFRDIRRIYRAAGAEKKCAFVFGNDGHRFYADLAWPKYKKMLAGL